MDIRLRWLVLCAVSLFAVSCADKESEDYLTKAERTLDAWMELNINNNGVVAEKLDNGMYLEWIDRNPDGEVPITGQWLDLEYRGFTMYGYDAPNRTGNLFMTRLEEDAKREGTFTYYTHYVPQLIQYNNSNNIMQGMQAALGFMKKGESVRLYLPATLASVYSALTVSNGYEGYMLNSTLNGWAKTIATVVASPVIVELSIVDIINDPVAREEQVVRDIAENAWGLTIKDTVRANLYLDILEYTVGADTVKTDSTATLNYTGRFALDPDFIFDTSIWDDATASHRKPGSALSYKPSSGGLIEAFQEVFNAGKITYGSKFRMVLTSGWGYGSSGNSGSSEPYTVIQPYDPLIFEVTVEPYETDEED